MTADPFRTLRVALGLFLAGGITVGLAAAFLVHAPSLAVLLGSAAGFGTALALGPVVRSGPRHPGGWVRARSHSCLFGVRGTVAAAADAAEMVVFEWLHAFVERSEEGGTVILEGRTQGGDFSNGEVLTVELAPADDGVVAIRMSSRPRWRGNLFDGGRNLRNVELFRAAMSEAPVRVS